MHKHTYEAYKGMIRVEIMLLQFKVRKPKMLQKIEDLPKRNISVEAILDNVWAFTCPRGEDLLQ
jgi:hypothetical protein